MDVQLWRRDTSILQPARNQNPVSAPNLEAEFCCHPRRRHAFPSAPVISKSPVSLALLFSCCHDEQRGDPWHEPRLGLSASQASPIFVIASP